MNHDFFTLDKIKTYKLIKGVVTHPLKLNRDNRGVLEETLKENWTDVYGEKLPFVQNYFSITKAGVARDEDRWHYHPTKQIDRFVVVSGNIIVALYDWRKQSKTFGLLNLFKMGETNGDEGQYLLMIPKNVLHCFLAIGKSDATILNYPTTLYDPTEEGRASFNQTKLVDSSYFSWNLVRDLLAKKGATC
jgi:dTDP-4-dehydrorhamnose 3,5-epimerase